MTIDLSRIKSYAPKARRDFIAAVANRAAKFGITAKGSLEARMTGDVVIIGGQAYPKSVGQQRERLLGRIAKEGYQEVIEQVAYTWFNRLAALRFLEVNEYLDHGIMVLGARPNSNGIEDPEALIYADSLKLDGLNIETIKALKIEGNRDEEIYRLVLVAQCDSLHTKMPFLFEKIGDETELLLPDGLLATDGLIRKLVMAIPESDWKEIEIIGWLYQFYISEKKDQIFSALKRNQKITAEKVPAATQLFTPHWIVRYLVENSLGRLWLLNNPSSRLADRMAYYIAPEHAETDFPRITKPEEIRICDPACGSGHMLTYAFDLMYEIYEEQGYEAAEIPGLIFRNNLTGVEIDDRAGALAAFALTMKAAAKLGQRRFLKMHAKPNIVVLQNVSFTTAEMTDVATVAGRSLFTDQFRETLLQFEQAKNIGSLIKPKLCDPAETLRELSTRSFGDDLLLNELQARMAVVLRMAEALSPNYQVVVANPPYAGNRSLNDNIQDFARDHYPNSKSDLFAMFMDRSLTLVRKSGYMAMINMQSWMFLSTFASLRKDLLDKGSLLTMAHLGPRGFDSIGGEVVSTTAFVICRAKLENPGSFFRLISGRSEDEKSGMLRDAAASRNHPLRFSATSNDFQNIPGRPIAYWLSQRAIQTFSKFSTLSDISTSAVGQNTGDNDLFLRRWFEVAESRINFSCRSRDDTFSKQVRWYPYNKGGGYRKWYGNFEYVVDWQNDADRIKRFAVERNKGKHWSRYIQNLNWLFHEGITWSDVTTGRLAGRFLPEGFISDVAGHCAFFDDVSPLIGLSALNSKFTFGIAQVLNPTIHFQAGNYRDLPYSDRLNHPNTIATVARLVELSKADWDAYETSWDFASSPLISSDRCAETIKASYAHLRISWQNMVDEVQRLEQENNRMFIDAYSLQDEPSSEVTNGEITLICNPAFRYGLKTSEAEREERLAADTVRELISYAIGCMMGRYALTKSGLVYANAGGEGFNSDQYGAFAADDDGIVPVTDRYWFDDDAAVRFADFLNVAWDGKALEENLRFVADNLSPKRGEAPVNTIRRYLSRSFFKDHLQTYNRRPIYWLFTSGPERAFECLVYLHRYNDRTLARIRAKYVTPLQTKMQNRLDSLKLGGGDTRSSAAEKSRLREIDTLQRQLHELSEFDDRLRQAMERNIKLDLDDGVRANYVKLRELLADADVVIGKKGDGDDE